MKSEYYVLRSRRQRPEKTAVRLNMHGVVSEEVLLTAYQMQKLLNTPVIAVCEPSSVNPVSIRT